MLSQEYLSSLEDWQKAGHRSVQIKLDCLDPASDGPSIWIYDYSVMTGIHVRPGDPLPDREELKKIGKSQLEREMASL